MYITDLLVVTGQSWLPPCVLVMHQVQKSVEAHLAVEVEWGIYPGSTQPVTDPYSTRQTRRSTSLLEFAPAKHKYTESYLKEALTYTQSHFKGHCICITLVNGLQKTFRDCQRGISLLWNLVNILAVYKHLLQYSSLGSTGNKIQ